MDWSPTLADREGPVYRHLVDALAADIANGRLRRGQQLPTHRALAKALSIDLTTVTRAYTEARRRGLTEARVGLGHVRLRNAIARSSCLSATAGV